MFSEPVKCLYTSVTFVSTAEQPANMLNYDKFTNTQNAVFALLGYSLQLVYKKH